MTEAATLPFCIPSNSHLGASHAWIHSIHTIVECMRTEQISVITVAVKTFRFKTHTHSVSSQYQCVQARPYSHIIHAMCPWLYNHPQFTYPVARQLSWNVLTQPWNHLTHRAQLDLCRAGGTFLQSKQKASRHSQVTDRCAVNRANPEVRLTEQMQPLLRLCVSHARWECVAPTCSYIPFLVHNVHTLAEVLQWVLFPMYSLKAWFCLCSGIAYWNPSYFNSVPNPTYEEPGNYIYSTPVYTAI